MTKAIEGLAAYQRDARRCTRCHDHGLIHFDGRRGVALPVLQKQPTGALGVLIVAEAPNFDDTYDPGKGYLTYDADTDPTGRYVRQLLLDEVGLSVAELGDVLFTNAVLCLPRGHGGKHPVSDRQRDHCRPWLRRLIDVPGVRVVVTMGARSLDAVRQIERHGLTLKDSGTMHDWFGRTLLPLYHASRVGRVSRPEALQRQDIRALRTFLGR